MANVSEEVAIDFEDAKKQLPNLGESDKNVYPRVELARAIFRIERLGVAECAFEIARLEQYIEQHQAVHLYRYLCDKNIIKFEQTRYDAMEKRDLEVRALLNRVMATNDEYATNQQFITYYSDYLSSIGDKSAAIAFLKTALGRTTTKTQTIEMNLHLVRIGFFYADRTLARESLMIAEKAVKESGDWHLKNLAYAYTALNSLWNRDVRRAATNFMAVASSFTAFDLMSLGTFCSYAAACSLLVLPRDKFYNKVVVGSEIQEGLYSAPAVANLAESFYTCNYRAYTECLKSLVGELKLDPFCSEHVDFLCREFRLRAYRQLLESFKSLTLDYLAGVFGLSKTFVENDVARFVAKGDLDCKIDLVREMVIVSLFDKKKREFNEFVDESTRLIADIQFMERTVNE